LFSKKPKTDPLLSNEALIEGIYQDFKRLMFSIAGRYTDNPADREDIVHGAIERLIKRAADLRTMDRPALASYVSFTVRSSAVDLLRNRKRTEGRDIPLDDADPDILEASALPLDDQLISAERATEMRAVLARLSETDRLLLEGKYFYGCSDQELAQLTGCKPDSVRMKLTRARRRALALLSDQRKEGEDHDKS